MKSLGDINEQDKKYAELRDKSIPRCYLIMEYCNGPKLSSFLLVQYKANQNKIPLKTVKALFKQILEANKYIHNELHIMHRDLKLDNILLVFLQVLFFLFSNFYT
jgi:serine/threonine protein kinase